MRIVEIKNITKTYHMGTVSVPVLHGISLSIEEGDFVAIMGPSGSGKSTLLHILGLLDKPSGGSYKLSGIETARMNDSQLATVRNVFLGFVFQSFNLLPRMSAAENVMMPLVYSENHRELRDHGRVKAVELLKKVGLSDRVNHKSNEMSGGQMQRVAIARALITDPAVIMADEPTGNLDSKSAREIIDILKKLNESGITIIMVTHEPDLAQAAKRIIRLQDGLVVSDEVITKNKSHAPDAKANSTNKAFTHRAFRISRMGDYFMQATRALFSNKTRSFLSILGVLIGVTGLIAMLALGNGAQEATKKNMSSLGSNLLMIMPTSMHRGGISMGQGSITRLTLEDSEAIRTRITGVTGVAPYCSGSVQVVYGNKNYKTRVDGTTPDYAVMKSAVPSVGRFFNTNEVTSRAKVAVIGNTVRTNLFADKDPLGEFIKVNGIDFQVIGILPTKGSSGFRDEDDKISVQINTSMYRLFGKEYIDSMDVQISDMDMMDTASVNIKNLITQLHRLTPDKNTIDIRNMADIQATISSTMQTFSYLLGGIACISLLVGGIGIMNIMLVSVTERTKEIGLRKAVGADNKDILFQFMIEAVAICAFGGVVGIIMGTMISYGLSVFAGWNTLVSMYSIVLAFTFSVVIGLIFGTWPARKASLLTPIDALRYE
jgi:macrolide transport system ATP-binding/permease protein